MLTPPAPEKYFMANGALNGVIMQVRRPIKTGMSVFRESLIYPMPIPGWIMMVISFKERHCTVKSFSGNLCPGNWLSRANLFRDNFSGMPANNYAHNFKIERNKSPRLP
jgi:hypothetical protein